MNIIRYRGVLLGAVAGALLATLAPVINIAGATDGDATARAPLTSAGPGFAEIVEQVGPAVVNISVSKSAPVVPAFGMPEQRFPQGRGDGPFDEFFGRFFDMPGAPSAPQEVQALGSGFIIDSAGYIVTNNHVIDGATEIKVTLQDERELDAELIGRDEKTDLALLKISDGDSLPFVDFGDSDRIRVGDWVVAIGNPFGLGGTATAGIVSARGRDIQSGPYDDYLQIDAPINSGNSGGPVFDAGGQVIGVSTAIYSPSGGNIGIGFAIPANQVKTIVAELRERGVVSRGWLGVQIQDLDKDLAASLNLPDTHGALIADVVDGSPADRAGLKTGDVITALNGTAIDSPRMLSRLIGSGDPNDETRLTVWRDGAERLVSVTLGRAQSARAATSHAAAPDSPTAKLGLQLRDLDADLRSRLDLSEDVAGAVITGVDAGSAAARKGIEPGDLLLAVDGRSVDAASEAGSAIDAAVSETGHAMLLLRRGDSQRFVALALS